MAAKHRSNPSLLIGLALLVLLCLFVGLDQIWTPQLRQLDQPHHRQPYPAQRRDAYQLMGYLGSGLLAGSKIRSKAGRTRWLGDARAGFRRHDTLRAILPGDEEFLLTVFTKGEAIAEDDNFLPSLGALVAAELSRG